MSQLRQSKASLDHENTNEHSLLPANAGTLPSGALRITGMRFSIHQQFCTELGILGH
jgi:hypothetical protein